MRLNPRTNGPSRVSYAVGMQLKRLPGGAETPVRGLPAQARISSPSWSPDNQYLAFTLTTPATEGVGGRVELWVADVATNSARRLLATPLNDVFGNPFEWVSDSQTLLARTVPAGRGAAPAADATPTGPAVQETGGGKKSGARTYQDLLKNPADERIFEYYATAQLVRVQLADGSAARPITTRVLFPFRASAFTPPSRARVPRRAVRRVARLFCPRKPAPHALGDGFVAE